MKEKRTFNFNDIGVGKRNDGQQIIKGVAVPYNSPSKDLGGFKEIFLSGAFKKSIQEDDVRALFGHSKLHVLGRNTTGTLTLRETSRGLEYEIKIPNTTYARDLSKLIERGDISGSSISFMVRKPHGERFEERPNGEVIRYVSDAILVDVSPETFPAYGQSYAEIARREFEKKFKHKVNRKSYRERKVKALQRNQAHNKLMLDTYRKRAIALKAVSS